MRYRSQYESDGLIYSPHLRIIVTEEISDTVDRDAAEETLYRHYQGLNLRTSLLERVQTDPLIESLAHHAVVHGRGGIELSLTPTLGVTVMVPEVDIMEIGYEPPAPDAYDVIVEHYVGSDRERTPLRAVPDDVLADVAETLGDAHAFDGFEHEVLLSDEYSPSKLYQMIEESEHTQWASDGDDDTPTGWTSE